MNDQDKRYNLEFLCPCCSDSQLLNPLIGHEPYIDFCESCDETLFVPSYSEAEGL